MSLINDMYNYIVLDYVCTKGGGFDIFCLLRLNCKPKTSGENIMRFISRKDFKDSSNFKED